MRAFAWALVLVSVAAVWPRAALAQLEFGAEKPRVFSIQRRPFRLGHEFQLGVGVLPLNAFYVGAAPQASYTYHFSDFWAWEIAGGAFSFNFGTGLKTDLFDRFGVEPVRGGDDPITLLLTTNGVAKPLFGKLALFNSSITYSETFFAAGVGGVKMERAGWLPTIDLGIGFRFWSIGALSWRLDIRDYLIFFSWLPENALMISLSAAFNYYEPDQNEAVGVE